MKKSIVLGLLILFSFMLVPSSYAINNDPYMIIANPGQNANYEMNISWHMDEGNVNGKIEYTTKGDVNWNNTKIIEANFKKLLLFNNRSFLKYEVSLQNLEKDTEYMYRVGSEQLSETYYFRTGGAEEFSFVWVGDWHSYLPIQSRTTSVTNVIKKAIEVEPSVDFMLTTGDMVAYGSDYDAWKNLYTFDQYKNYMWTAAIGNHDAMNNDGGSNSDDFFAATSNYPKNGYQGQKGKSYYFKYSNSLFIVMNTENTTQIGGLNRIKAQNWVREIIKNNPSDFIFVSMHHNWFSGQTGSNLEYNNWKLFFSSNGVDLAMSGHNHIYLRTHRLYNDIASTDKGTVYMQNPSSDNDRGRSIIDIANNKDKIVKTWTEDANTVGAIIITVGKDNINTRLIDRNGAIHDQTNISKTQNDYNFNKVEFLESFIYMPSLLSSTSGIISSSASGVGFVDKIEYFDNNNLLATNYFYQRTDASFKIDNISSINEIKVKISFKDGQVEFLNLKIVDIGFYRVKDVKLTIENSKYKLTWSYASSDELKAWVFVNDEPATEVKLNTQGVFLDDLDPTDEVSIRTSIDSKNKYYLAKYHTYGDANFDGKIDLSDIGILQDYLLTNNILSPADLEFLDIDLDGTLTIFDITYVHLYINELVEKLEKVNYEVAFMNYLGEKKTSIFVPVKDPALYTNADNPMGYIFIGWNKDISSINTDLIVYPIFEYFGEYYD